MDLAPFYQDEAYDAAPDTILKKRKKRNNSFDKNSDPKFEKASHLIGDFHSF